MVGARQVGKTTLLQQLRSELNAAGERTLFFNLDVEADAAHFVNQQRFLAKLSLETGGEPSFVFIDEIQRKENAGLFLKGIYDLSLPYKFIVSGSGSLELKEKIHESLAGRKRIFELHPVSFAEFVNYRTGYRYEGKLPVWMAVEPEQTRLLLIEYLNFGGYPRVVVAGQASEKRLILQELFNSYLEKDLVTLLRLEKTRAFTLMFRLLADRIGHTVNYSGLSRETGLSQPTVKQYFWYAEKTFMIKLLPPFFRNAGKELTKSPQVYFNDLGMRNSALGLAGRLDNLATMGMIFQNFIFHQLTARAEQEFVPLRFWRTKDQAEVDFVLDKISDSLPVEVKCIDISAPVVPRSLRSFINTYQPKEAWVVTLSLEEEAQVNGTLVKFIPWRKLISE